MGWFSRKIEEAPPERKASAAGRILPGGRGVNWTPREGGALTRAGFAGNPVGFRSIRLIAESCGALPVVADGGRTVAHPALSLLARPNPAQGRAELVEAVVTQMLLTGDGYVEAVGDGMPAELHVLRSDRMSVVPGADGWPVAYDYTVGSRKVRFAAETVCHLRGYHPADDHYGLSPMQAAASAVDVHNAASQWSKALLDNAARPSGAIVNGREEPLGQEQFERLQAEMETYHQGARNAGRPMLLDGGLDWKPMGFSPSDMEFQRTKEAAAREIATAFGVPPMMLGIPGDATYANYAEANRAFFRLTVIPMAQRVAARLGGWLSELSGRPVALSVDLDEVPALAAERDARWARIAGADFLSDGEKRRLLGLPEEA